MDHRWEEAEARLLKQSLSRANKSKQAQRLNAVVCTGSTRCTVLQNCLTFETSGDAAVVLQISYSKQL